MKLSIMNTIRTNNELYTNKIVLFKIITNYNYKTKSTSERVSNAVYYCINGIFCKLHHDSTMNIILRP